MNAMCPECGAVVRGTPSQCPQCGVELGPPMPPSKPPMADNTRYMIIIGSIIGIIVVVLLLTSMMGPAGTCKECRGKGSVVCQNCKDGKPKCLACKGSGNDPQTFSTCMACRGTGAAPSCPHCQGAGRRTCPACRGAGTRPR